MRLFIEIRVDKFQRSKNFDSFMPGNSQQVLITRKSEHLLFIIEKLELTIINIFLLGITGSSFHPGF